MVDKDLGEFEITKRHCKICKSIDRGEVLCRHHTKSASNTSSITKSIVIDQANHKINRNNCHLMCEKSHLNRMII